MTKFVYHIQILNFNKIKSYKIYFVEIYYNLQLCVIFDVYFNVDDEVKLFIDLILILNFYSTLMIKSTFKYI